MIHSIATSPRGTRAPILFRASRYIMSLLVLFRARPLHILFYFGHGSFSCTLDFRARLIFTHAHFHTRRRRNSGSCPLWLNVSKMSTAYITKKKNPFFLLWKQTIYFANSKHARSRATVQHRTIHVSWFAM